MSDNSNIQSGLDKDLNLNKQGHITKTSNPGWMRIEMSSTAPSLGELTS